MWPTGTTWTRHPTTRTLQQDWQRSKVSSLLKSKQPFNERSSNMRIKSAQDEQQESFQRKPRKNNRQLVEALLEKNAVSSLEGISSSQIGLVEAVMRKLKVTRIRAEELLEMYGG